MEHLSVYFEHEKPIVGVIHLLALPGAPNFDGSEKRIVEHALTDAEALIAGGVDAIMLENFGDTPYFAERVPRETIAWMTRVGGLVRDRYRHPLGVCVLRNDARAALAIAHAIDAQFIRTCILGSPRVTDQGVISGHAAKLLRDRARLGANIGILADVDIKHSYPLSATYSLRADAADLVSRSHADALVVTGTATGAPVDEAHLIELASAAQAPVFVGSGVTSGNIAALSGAASGFIVGTAFKDSTEPIARVDVDKVRAIVQELRG